MATNGVSTGENPDLQPNQQNVPRRVGPSLIQDPIPTRPDVGGGGSHLRGTAAEVQGSNTVSAIARPHEQVMSPSLGSGFGGAGGLQETSSSMAASYAVAGGDAGEDEIFGCGAIDV